MWILPLPGFSVAEAGIVINRPSYFSDDTGNSEPVIRRTVLNSKHKYGGTDRRTLTASYTLPTLFEDSSVPIEYPDPNYTLSGVVAGPAGCINGFVDQTAAKDVFNDQHVLVARNRISVWYDIFEPVTARYEPFGAYVTSGSGRAYQTIVGQADAETNYFVITCSVFAFNGDAVARDSKRISVSSSSIDTAVAEAHDIAMDLAANVPVPLFESYYHDPIIVGNLRSADVSEEPLNALFNQFRLNGVDVDPLGFGRASANLADNLPAIDTDTVAFLYDLPAVGETLKTYKSLPKALKKASGIKAITKVLAGTYLSSIFGDVLTAADLMTFYKYTPLLSNSFKRRGSSDGVATLAGATLTGTCSIVADLQYLSDLARWVNKSYEYGLFTYANLWDIVPFSFVVDYFVNIGNYLERIDLQNRMATIDVVAACSTFKGSCSVQLPYTDSSGVTGYCSCSVTAYQRIMSNTLPSVPPIGFEYSNPSGKQVLTIGALLTNCIGE